MILGFLTDVVLRKYMYLTVSFVTLCQILYLACAFGYNVEIATDEGSV